MHWRSTTYYHYCNNKFYCNNLSETGTRCFLEEFYMLNTDKQLIQTMKHPSLEWNWYFTCLIKLVNQKRCTNYYVTYSNIASLSHRHSMLHSWMKHLFLMIKLEIMAACYAFRFVSNVNPIESVQLLVIEVFFTLSL